MTTPCVRRKFQLKTPRYHCFDIVDSRKIVNGRDFLALSKTGLRTHCLESYCSGAKTRIAAACSPWRRTAKNNRLSSGEKKPVRAPGTVAILSDSL
jgi:hypothetical protein